MNSPRKIKMLTPAFSVLLFLIAGCSQKTNERWTAPDNPNPQTVLDEAEQDATAKRYENALAKHVWFHENALKIQPSLYGVRLSFALSAWVELGKSYPPALEKLRSTRDETSKTFREGKASRDLFHDFESINDRLGETAKTKELFLWLDTHNPNAAKLVFDIAEPALVKAKEYRLCGKYLDPNGSFRRMRDSYRYDKQRISKNPKIGKDMLREYAENSFSHKTTTLVALLTVNGRKDEAALIAAEAASEWDDPMFKTRLEKAKNGEVPVPWP
ncbi:MAG: hypothetical protein V9H26_03780 [Verrucomicrobiota bacterium]